MQGPQHQLVAVATGIAAGQALEASWPVRVALIGGAFLTARLPDLMQNGGPEAPRGKHRNASHSLLAAAFWGLVVAVPCSIWVPWALLPAALSLECGYCSHLFADTMTRKGVPLFWPLIKTRYHTLPKVLRLQTEGAEQFVAVLLLGGAIAWAALGYHTS